MDSKRFIELVENAGDGDYRPRRYSGRAMYGRQCVGVEFDRGTSEARLVAEMALALTDSGDADLITAELRELCEIVKNTRTDSMGLGSIAYWPSLKWPEDDEEDEEDDDEDDADGDRR